MTVSNPIVAAVESAEPLRDERLEGCPVQALGHYQGNYYFLSPVGELRIMKPSDFTVNGLTSLFEGLMTWLLDKFPRYNKHGDLIGFSANDSAAFLVEQCRLEGLWDSSIEERGVGVWRCADDDGIEVPRLLVHCGNTLHYGGEVLCSGQKIGHAIYPAAPAIAPLAPIAASAADGQELFRIVRHWNFQRPEISHGLFLGFLGQAMLGGAAYWRAHMMINGQAGSGKSWLAKLAGSVMGAAAHPMTNNFSEAGLRQAMTKQARCLILDEAEAEDGGGRIQAVVELLRHMSGSDGARALRGSSGGQSQSFSVTGSALMLSILRIPLRPQDRSRITQINLDPARDDIKPAQIDQIKYDIAAMRKLSPRFRRRMIDLWPVFLRNFEVYRAALLEQELSSRGADQLATLLAGRDTLLRDVPVSGVSSVIDELADMQDFLTEEKDVKLDHEGEQCLNHLYSSMVDAFRAGEKETVGQVLERIIKEPDHNDERKLATIGIRIERNHEGRFMKVPSAIIVANKHVGLNRLFDGTRWSGGGWSGAFEYLGGARTKPKRFAGAQSRGTEIPSDHWPDREVLE